MTHDTPPKRMVDLISREAALAIIDPGDGDFHAGNYNGIAALPTVTGYTLTSEADAMVAAALRDLAQRVALQMEVLSAIHQSWPLRTAGKVDAILALIPQPATAALDKLIAEAAETIHDLMTALAEAQAAQAATVLAEDGPDLGASSREPSLRSILHGHYVRWLLPEGAAKVVDRYLHALADPTGVALLAELRAERDTALQAETEYRRKNHALTDERDRLAAANAVLEAKETDLMNFVRWACDAPSLHQVQQRAHELLGKKDD